MSVQSDKSERDNLSPELLQFQSLFFEMLDAYIRTLYGEGTYDVKISKRGPNSWKPEFERVLITIIKGATGVVDQFALAEQMMLFWGERVEKLSATIKGGG